MTKVFQSTHRQFFKTYSYKTNFKDIALNGNYNCVTASLLYSLVLDDLGYSHYVLETEDHAYIVAKLEKGEVVLETTDPLQTMKIYSSKAKKEAFNELKKTEIGQ